MYSPSSPDRMFFDVSSSFASKPFDAYHQSPIFDTRSSSEASWSYCVPVTEEYHPSPLYADFDDQFSHFGSDIQPYYIKDAQPATICPSELSLRSNVEEPLFPLSEQKVALTALLENEARRAREQDDFEEDSEEDSLWSPELPTVFEEDEDEELQDEWLEGFVQFRPNPALLSSNRRGGSDEEADVGLREVVLIKNFLRELNRIRREQKAQKKMLKGLSAADFAA